MELGLNEANDGGSSGRSEGARAPKLTLYKEAFEKLFIENTEAFYNTEADSFLAGNPITEYMKKVSSRACFSGFAILTRSISGRTASPRRGTSLLVVFAPDNSRTVGQILRACPDPETFGIVPERVQKLAVVGQNGR